MLMQPRIVKYIKNVRRGQTTEHEDEEPLMLDLVKDYSNFDNSTFAIEGAIRTEGQETVVRSHS